MVPLPRRLAPRELALFTGIGRRVELAAGRAVFRRGESGHGMFVVGAGHVLLDPGDAATGRMLGTGEYFGELALYARGCTRMADATAAEECVVHVIDADAFAALLEREPLLMARFMLRSFGDLAAREPALAAAGAQQRGNDAKDPDVAFDARVRDALATPDVDDLTRLASRRALFRFLDARTEVRDRQRRFGLLLVDVDHFKRLNDAFGHVVGDEVLCAVAAEVCDAAGDTDLPCRLGGDEFALLAQVRDADELAARATRIVECVRRLRFVRAAPELNVSVSVGGGLCGDDDDWSVWYREADCALYDIRRAGGDGAHVMA